MAFSRILGLCALLLAASVPGGPARAQGTGQDRSAPPGWSFAVTPYAWLPALSGNLTTPLPRIGDRRIELGSGAVLTDLSTVPVMVAGEARYGRFAVLGDLFYAGLQQDASTPRDLLFQGGHVRVVSTIFTLLGMVKVVETEGQGIELGAGTRIWNFNNKVSLDPGLAAGVIQKSTIGWADPLLAARYTARLSPRLGLTVYGDIGGFDTGSRLTWQAQGTLDFAATQSVELRGGWRYLSVDRSRGDVGIDLGFNGPFFAATFRF